MKKSLIKLLSEKKQPKPALESEEPQATEVTEGEAEAVTSLFGPEGEGVKEGDEGATTSLSFEAFQIKRAADTAIVLLGLRNKLAKGAKSLSIESIAEVEVQEAEQAAVPTEEAVIESSGAPEGAVVSESEAVPTAAPIETAEAASDEADAATGEGDAAEAAVDAGATAEEAVDVAEELSADELETMDMVSTALVTGESDEEGVLPSVESLQRVSRAKAIRLIDATVAAAVESIAQACNSKREDVAKMAVAQRFKVQKKIQVLAK